MAIERGPYRLFSKKKEGEWKGAFPIVILVKLNNTQINVDTT